MILTQPLAALFILPPVGKTWIPFEMCFSWQDTEYLLDCVDANAHTCCCRSFFCFFSFAVSDNVRDISAYVKSFTNYMDAWSNCRCEATRSILKKICFG